MLDIFFGICTTPPSKIKWSTPKGQKNWKTEWSDYTLRLHAYLSRVLELSRPQSYLVYNTPGPAGMKRMSECVSVLYETKQAETSKIIRRKRNNIDWNKGRFPCIQLKLLKIWKQKQIVQKFPRKVSRNSTNCWIFEMRTIQPKILEILRVKLNEKKTSGKKFPKIWLYLARLSYF